MEYEKEHKEALSQGPVYFENPVYKFMLTKRLTNDWPKIENVMLHEEGKAILKNIKGYSIKITEYEGGIDGFLRLQDTYRLNTTDMAQGILQGFKYNTQLEARHCYDIGKRASAEKYSRLGYHWLMEALNSYKANNSQREFSPSKLKRLYIELALANAKYQLGDIRGANETYVELINRYPKSLTVAKQYAQFLELSAQNETKEVDYSLEHEPVIEDIGKAGPDLAYKYTCAGIYKKTPRQERHLVCGYLTETHPFLLLAPIKVEEMNHDPLVVVFYDVVYDSEIEIMKNLTTNLQRAKVMATKKSVISTVRTSQFVFIDVKEHPVLGVIDQRVEDMTNFNMKYVEKHQFANYGIGGHYAQHHDFFSKENMNPNRLSLFQMGNRIATVLFYLTDVEQGGGTAFPILKLHLLPKKGSAAFWFNLHASGERDQRTLHGACPITVGSKWVLNRWIREHDQSDRRPCFLYDDAKY